MRAAPEDILEFFLEEDREDEASAHLILQAAVPEGAQNEATSLAEASGPEAAVVLLRLNLAEPRHALARRLIGWLAARRPVIMLSDPTLPSLSASLVDRIRAVDPSAPLWLLHDDGLDLLRHAAKQPDVAIEWIEPEAGLHPGVASVRKIRDDLARAHADRAAAQAPELKRPGWFGSGVVAAPLAPLMVRTLQQPTWDVAAGVDPAVAAAEIIERAFGPAVLGGFSTAAISRVRIAAESFSAVTQELLDQLVEVAASPRYDPPFWVLDRPDPSEAMARAKRLGLDEGATLIFERREARGDGKPYGAVFTNGEPRMRTSGAARALGVLLLIRGAPVGRAPSLNCS